MTKRSEVRSPLKLYQIRHPSSFRMDFDHGGLAVATLVSSTAVAVERCFLAWCGSG